MRRLIVDASPILYGALFSATSYARRNGAKPDVETGLIPFDYKDVLSFKILEEFANLKNEFQVDEVILAFDNSANGGYWRKKFYDRYKYGRKEGRDKSDIDWSSAFSVFEELREILTKSSSFKVLSVPHMEADDIGFVLSEHFSTLTSDVTILHTLDHDWSHNLKYSNVELFKTRKTQRLPGIYVTKTQEELEMDIEEHCIGGDPGDGFLHMASFTQFSDEFLAEHPKFEGREIEMYDKHHQIEKMYNDKHNWTKKAYKHKRFGYKSFKKSKKTLQNLFDENPIHKWNYERNQKLCLPEGIPEEFKTQIIEYYNETEDKRNAKELQKFFNENGLFELIGKLTQF